MLCVEQSVGNIVLAYSVWSLVLTQTVLKTHTILMPDECAQLNYDGATVWTTKHRNKHLPI
jgi:hypothetical protein